MHFSKLFYILTCCLLIMCQHSLAQYGGLGYNPGYSGLGGLFGRPIGGYPMYGYYPHYPMYGSYPCYTSIYCGGANGFGYGGYPFYQNGFNTAYSSSSSNSGFYSSYGGFFG